MFGLESVRRKLEAVVTGFEPGTVAAGDVPGVLADLTAIANLAAVATALLAPRVEDTGAWRTAGARSPEEWFAAHTGSSEASSKRALRNGRRMGSCPALSDAARTGGLSPAKVDALAGAAAVAPGAMDDLVDGAADASLSDVRDRVGEAKRAATTEAQREARARRRRRFSHWIDDDGEFNFRGSCSVSDGVALLGVLKPWGQAHYRHALLHGDPDGTQPDHTSGYILDALLRLIHAGAAALGTPPDADASPDPDTDTDTDAAHVTAATAADPTAATATAAAASRTTEPTPAPSNDANPPGNTTPPDTGSRAVTLWDHTTPPNPNSPNTPASEPNGGHGPPSHLAPVKPAGGIHAQVIIRIDATALERGHALPGETCELVGTGPIPVTTVVDAITNGATTRAIATGAGTGADGHPVAVATLPNRSARGTPTTRDLIDALTNHGVDPRPPTATRAPTTAQRIALLWRDPICTVADCTRPTAEIDHRHDWAHTHITQLDHLDGLCRHHHTLKTRSNWQLSPGTGKRPLVPPHDPRHPQHPDNITGNITGRHPPPIRSS